MNKVLFFLLFASICQACISSGARAGTSCFALDLENSLDYVDGNLALVEEVESHAQLFLDISLFECEQLNKESILEDFHQFVGKNLEAFKEVLSLYTSNPKTKIDVIWIDNRDEYGKGAAFTHLGTITFSDQSIELIKK